MRSERYGNAAAFGSTATSSGRSSWPVRTRCVVDRSRRSTSTVDHQCDHHHTRLNHDPRICHVNNWHSPNWNWLFVRKQSLDSNIYPVVKGGARPGGSGWCSRSHATSHSVPRCSSANRQAPVTANCFTNAVLGSWTLCRRSNTTLNVEMHQTVLSCRRGYGCRAETHKESVDVAGRAKIERSYGAEPPGARIDRARASLARASVHAVAPGI